MVAPTSGEASWRRSRIVIPGVSPAAGADWTVTVPAGHIYQLLAVFATLVTSAAAATRIARLLFTDGDSTFLELPPFTSQIASLTRRYAWIPAGQAYSTGLGILSPLPELTLMAGWTIGTATDVVDVGDQWGTIKVAVIDTTVKGGKLDLRSFPDFHVALVPTPAEQ